MSSRNAQEFDRTPYKDEKYSTVQSSSSKPSYYTKIHTVQSISKARDLSGGSGKKNLYQRSKEAQIARYNSTDLRKDKNQRNEALKYSSNGKTVSTYYSDAKEMDTSSLKKTRFEKVPSKDAIPFSEPKIQDNLRSPTYHQLNEAEKSLSEMQKSLIELKRRSQEKEQLINELRVKLGEQSAEALKYTQIKQENQELKQQFKAMIQEQEEIKQQAKNKKNETIQHSFKAEDSLSQVVLKIKLTEEKLQKIYEQIAISEKAIAIQKKVTQSHSTLKNTKVDRFYYSKSGNVIYSCLTQCQADLKVKVQDMERKLDNRVGDAQIVRKQSLLNRKRADHRLGALHIKHSMTKLFRRQYQYSFKAIANASLLEIPPSIRIARIIVKAAQKIEQSSLEYMFCLWSKNAKLRKIHSLNKQSQIYEKKHSPDYLLVLSLFTKWRQAYQDRCAYRVNQGRDFKSLIESLSLRVFKKQKTYAFQVWKSLIVRRWKGQFRLIQILKRKQILSCKEAFSMWSRATFSRNLKQTSLELLRGRSLRQLKARVFYGLRHGILQEKQEIFQTKVKFYKQWRLRYLQNVFVRGVSQLQSVQHEEDKTLLQKCLSKMRYFAQKQKLERIDSHYNENCYAVINQCEQDISSEDQRMRQRKERTFLKGVLAWKFRSIRPYFNYWKDLIDHEKNVKQVMLYRKLKNYKLLQAFGQWKYKAQCARNDLKMKRILGIQSKSTSIMEEVISMKTEIKQLQDKSKQKGVQKCVRALLHQQNIILSQFFTQWYIKTKNTERHANRIRVVLARWKMKTLRIYFQQFSKNVRKIVRYEKDEKLLQVYQSTKYRTRLLKRYFKIINDHKNEMMIAKKYLSVLCLKKDRLDKDNALKQWKKVFNKKQIAFVNEVEMEAIESYTQTNQEIAEKTAIIEKQEQQLDRAGRVESQQAAYNLRTYIQIMIGENTQHAFAKWKEFYLLDKERTTKLRHAIVMIKRRFQSQGFQLWKTLVMEHRIQMVRNKSVQKTKISNGKMIQSTMNQKELQQIEQRLQEKLEVEINSAQIYKMRHSKLIKLFFAKHEQYNVEKFHYWIFRMWATRYRIKKQKLRSLCRVGTHYHQRSFLETLKLQHVDHSQNSMSKRTLKKALKMFEKSMKRQAISQWKFALLGGVNENRAQAEGQIDVLSRVIQEKTNLQKEGIVSLMSNFSGQKMTQKVFQAWRLIIDSQKALARSNIQFDINTNHMKVANAMRLWRKRAKKTKRARHLYSKTFTLLGVMTLKNAFSALKQQTNRNKERTRRLVLNINVLLSATLQHSFNAIRNTSMTKPSANENRKQISIKQLISSIITLESNSLRTALNSLKATSTTVRLRNTLIKKALRHQSNKALMQYFKKWIQDCQLKRTYKETNELSDMRIDILILHQDVQNLKCLMKNERISDRDINGILYKAQCKDDQQMRKAIARMKHLNDQMFHKPKYFDALKKAAVEGKQRRTSLKRVVLNALGRRNVHNAFYIWKMWSSQNELQLSRMKTNDLEKIRIEQCQKKQELSKGEYVQEREKHLRIKTLGQLSEKMMTYQSLFLKLYIRKKEAAQEKAFFRWYSSTQQAKKELKRNQMKKQLDVLNDLKLKLEEEKAKNLKIKKENEFQHRQAGQILNQAHEAQILYQQTSDLNVLLADKALQMKRLLEDNKNLSIRISNERLSQSSLTKSNGMSMSTLRSKNSI